MKKDRTSFSETDFIILSPYEITSLTKCSSGLKDFSEERIFDETLPVLLFSPDFLFPPGIIPYIVYKDYNNDKK